MRMIERVDIEEVAVLRLAHGPVAALDLELCTALAETFSALADDPARAVVITGTGRSFSAGVDLHRIVGGGPDYVARFLPALSAALRAVFTVPKPVVAAVNGHAIAGGCVLAAAADTTFMADGPGRIGIPETRVGVPFPRTALEVMYAAVGPAVTRRLVVGGQTHPASVARELGLVDAVVPAADLVETAVATARALATEIPADAFAVTKAQSRRPHLDAIERYADEEAQVTAIWQARAADGWVADYLAAVTGRSRAE